MKRHIKRIVEHPLISGSAIIFTGTFISNIFNWLFNLFIGGHHLLSVSDYGLYSSLMSLLVLFGIFQGTLANIFTKFSAQYTARKDEQGKSDLVSGGFRFLFLLATAILFVLCLSSWSLQSFLHIGDIRLLFLIFLTIYFSILTALPSGVLQGELHFFFLSATTILGPVLKIVFGIMLILLGLKVFGAMIALVISGIIPLILLCWYVYKKNKINLFQQGSTNFKHEFIKFSLPFFLATLGITIISSTDILFVRHFFSPENAGYYAAVSVMGKSIFYVTAPIYVVFFPLIAQKKEKEESLRGTLLLAIGIISFISLSASFAYFFFPQLILKIFFPASAYAGVGKYLGIYSLFMFVYSLVTLLHNFLLSLGKTQVYKINLFVAILFIVLITFLHQTLYQVVYVLIFVSLVSLLLLLNVLWSYGKHRH
ncbi:MAG TPA: oligosaccharide flippase family protein [Patescibacteria group bacterium]|nr:oligosaccharide flippase family protein [Patescibacteria group bacterium]